MGRPVGSALSVVRGIVAQQVASREIPTVEEVMAVIRGFERIGFEVPVGGDSDGFLFQYGEVNWLSEPTFVVGFVRQMEFVDVEGEHEGYSQVRLECRYHVDADRSFEGRLLWNLMSRRSWSDVANHGVQVSFDLIFWYQKSSPSLEEASPLYVTSECLIVAISWSRSGEVLSILLDLASSHGLSAYDPQDQVVCGGRSR